MFVYIIIFILIIDWLDFAKDNTITLRLAYATVCTDGFLNLYNNLSNFQHFLEFNL